MSTKKRQTPITQEYYTEDTTRMNLSIITIGELRAIFSSHLRDLLTYVPSFELKQDIKSNYHISEISLNNAQKYKDLLIKYMPDRFYIAFKNNNNKKKAKRE